jgi:hypothetical protein
MGTLEFGTAGVGIPAAGGDAIGVCGDGAGAGIGWDAYVCPATFT